jgi:protein phosphatase
MLQKACGSMALSVVAEPLPVERVQGRYELQRLLSSRGPLERWHARDHESQQDVILLRQPLPRQDTLPSPEPVTESLTADDEILPSFDEPEMGHPATQVLTGSPVWPSVGWEKRLLSMLESPALPKIVHYFCDDTHECLVEEIPHGTLLWDAWDDPDAGASQRFGYLVQVAELLHRLHQVNAMVEGLRPELLCVSETGDVRLNSLDDLLPLPLPPDTPIKGSLYTAPELLGGHADARADLYGFGAMLYALHVGRELNERTDFEKPGVPKPFIPQYPDCHPMFGRLMMKTFRREVEARFPTDEASREDATGFLELIRVLEVLRRTYDNVHLEIAAWTNTGIVRSGNEDAYAILHAAESRQEDIGEAALVFLCDGMGGYEAGEVAAAMTLQSLRDSLRTLRPFSVAAGVTPFVTDPQTQMHRAEGHLAGPVDVEAVKAALRQALRDANRLVFTTSRAPGSKRRGMGCTAEAVYVDGQNVIVGHVGDSRVYHLHEGHLIQLTRDQTLVNRLMELGQLTPAEAETHPRRNELQQAIGGQPDVEPGLYHGKMSPGDWVIVCSDGLTNHVKDLDLKQMLQSEAVSAEMAARRLVNLTLIEGASDNVTVVAIRAT